MKLNITVETGELPEDDLTVKEYSSGEKIISSGKDVATKIVGKEPVSVNRVKANKAEAKKFMHKPDNFKINKGKLVRKGKNK